MAERNLSVAQACLQAATSHAQTPIEEAETVRLQALLNCLVRFWDAVRDGMARLEIAEEIVLDDSRVIAVNATANERTVRADGENRTYRTQFPPVDLALAMVERKTPPTPMRDVLCAAFLTTDRAGYRAQAHRPGKAATKPASTPPRFESHDRAFPQPLRWLQIVFRIFRPIEPFPFEALDDAIETRCSLPGIILFFQKTLGVLVQQFF